MTGAEWITFRFGSTAGAQAAHGVVVLFALFNVVCFIAFSFVGIGKFASRFVAHRLAPAGDDELNDQLWGFVFVAVTTLYVVKGGMTGVVVTEVMQFGIMTVASVAVGAVAMARVPDPAAAIAGRVPEGWTSPWFGEQLMNGGRGGMSWEGLLPAAAERMKEDGMSDTFAAFFALMTAKGCMQAMSGPAPNYDMQRVLAARTPTDAARMSALVSAVLLVPRYMLVTGLTLLAIAKDFPAAAQQPGIEVGEHEEELLVLVEREGVFLMMNSSSGSTTSGSDVDVDFEAVLPFAMREFMPQGLRGLLVAALLSAFMSTFAATVNAAPAYLVNDVYRKYVSPDATERNCVRLSYASALLAVSAGVGVGFYVNSLDDILQWIVGALYGGYTAPNVLKFHWWRFNAHGYFWGMFSGIVAALAVPRLAYFEGIAPLYAFPPIFAASLAASVVASLVTDPDPPAVLDEFYLRVRPWGFWGPVALRATRSSKYVMLKPMSTTTKPPATNTTTNHATGGCSSSCTPSATSNSNDSTDTTNSTRTLTLNSRGIHGRGEEIIGQHEQDEALIEEELDPITEFHVAYSSSTGVGGGRGMLTSSFSCARNKDFGKDAFNVVVGVVWQTALTLLGCCFVLRLWNGVISAVVTICGGDSNFTVYLSTK